jgi:hypothetical protein
MKLRKLLVLVALVSASAAALVGANSAMAYGKADGPIAQVEISGNCNNNAYCSTYFGGTGGIWIWAEIDSGGTVDATLAGCGHTVGGGGPGSAGAGGGPTTGTWTIVSRDQMLADAGSNLVFPVALAVDKFGSLLNVTYYEIDFGGGFVVAVPTVKGHYNVSGLQYLFGFASGVNFQTQVAP